MGVHNHLKRKISDSRNNIHRTEMNQNDEFEIVEFDDQGSGEVGTPPR